MTKLELINQLAGYPDDMQVFLACDEEENIIYKTHMLYARDFTKTNGDGAYEAIVLIPTSQEVEPYEPIDEDELL